MKPGRIPSCVPYCRRTACAAKYSAGTEIICGKHWRMAPAAWRRRRSRLQRMRRLIFGDSAYWTFPAGSPKRLYVVRLDRLIDRLWDRCKRAAINAGMGIG